MLTSMRVIVFTSQKGGSGKTTLSGHVAVQAERAGAGPVALVDTDPQGSLARWVEARRRARPDNGDIGFTFSQIAGWRLAGEAERLARDHDIVLIDSAPHAETEARIAIRAATLVIVPVQPSPMDLWATQPTLELALAERLPALLVINRMPPRARLAMDMTEKLATLGVGVATATLGNRIAFAESLADGAGVSESEPGSSAAAEIAAVGEEIWSRTS